MKSFQARALRKARAKRARKKLQHVAIMLAIYAFLWLSVIAWQQARPQPRVFKGTPIPLKFRWMWEYLDLQQELHRA